MTHSVCVSHCACPLAEVVGSWLSPEVAVRLPIGLASKDDPVPNSVTIICEIGMGHCPRAALHTVCAAGVVELQVPFGFPDTHSASA